MKLFLILRDSKNLHPNYKIKFNILNNPLANRWTELLIDNIFGIDHPLEKDNCLKGWVTSWDSTLPRNIEFLCFSINTCIGKINDSLGPLGYPYIDLEFSKEKLQGNEYRELMNKIHHHFEILIGQTWKPSKWFLMADASTKQNIRLINNLCHEIENTVDAIQLNEKHPTFSNQYIFASLMGPNFEGKYITGKKREELTFEQLTSFSDFSRWGDVNIYYAQLGKRHIEVFRDQDQEIDFENISGYRYLTGEFVVSFSGVTIDKEVRLPESFFEWLDKHGFDRNDPTLALGFPRVAEVICDDRLELIKNLKLRDDLYQIGLEDDQGNVTYLKTYDFFWQDLNQLHYD